MPSDIGMQNAARTLGNAVSSSGGEVGNGLQAVAVAIEAHAVASLAAALIASNRTRDPEYAMIEARRAVNNNG